jgi:tRNA-(ms[2]io[6]A)-hydroxylase
MGDSSDGKRRLPILPRTEVAAEGDEDRPPWHWSAIGAVGLFVLWFPLAIGVNALVPGPGAAWTALNVAAFLLAGFAAGFLVGRFGGKAGRREATVGGAAAGGAAWLAAVSLGAIGGALVWAILLAVMGGLGGGAARVGGAIGVSRRRS